MDTETKMKILEKASTDYKCTCDDGPPWSSCKGCIAGGALNEISRIAYDTVDKIKGMD
jgi:hypothetical protein